MNEDVSTALRHAMRCKGYRKRLASVVHNLTLGSLAFQFKAWVAGQIGPSDFEMDERALVELEGIHNDSSHSLEKTIMARAIHKAFGKINFASGRGGFSLPHALLDTIRTLQKEATLLDNRLRMPPVRQEGEPEPKGLVEKRAFRAKKGLKLWTSRLKYAQTKVKKYRKKVTYYKKKGAIE